MKRLLTLLVVCLGMLGGVKAQTAKAVASYLDTIYLTYRLSADDTIRGVSVDIEVNLYAVNSTIYFDWGESRSAFTIKNLQNPQIRDFSGTHRWKNTNTGDVLVKIYGVSRIRSYLVSLKTHSSATIKDVEYTCAPLVQIDVRNCTELTDLSFYGKSLELLNVKDCKALKSLDCGYQNLTSLDLTGCAKLTSLDCRDNRLISLDLTGCAKLTSLDCRDNRLNSLDLTGCAKLTSLDCRNNRLTSLDVSECTALTSLNCSNNRLLVIMENENATFDLSWLPNFDVERTSDWNGGAVSGNTLTFHQDTVTYGYDTRYRDDGDKMQTFTLIRKLGDTVPSPVFTPNGGEYDCFSGGVVTINSEIEGTTIYYRYGDSTVWKEYTEPIPIIDTCPIKAKAVHNRYITESPEVEVRFIPKKTVKPVITPSGGAVEAGTTVTISCDTADATIHYTLDGSDPTEQSAVYTAPIVINEGMTIKARSQHRCYTFSEVIEASFTIMPEMAKPVFTPNGGDVARGSSVEITCETPSAVIHYTTDGSMPTEQSAVYGEPIVINEAMTIKAMAVRNHYVPSEVAEASYTIMPEVAKPVITPGSGAVEAGSTVTISCATNNAVIHYTTDGTVPTEESAVYAEPIVVNTAVTIKAIAVCENCVNSAVAEASYTIMPEVAKPVIAPGSGAVEAGSTVAISCATDNAVIHYTTDGTAPDAQSAVYSEPIVINTAMTIKAIAVCENYVNSAVAEAIYTIMPEVAMPVITPGSGAVEAGSTVAISCATDNAVIHYTTDGTAPNTQSAVYSEPIVINTAMTIKAIAVCENYVNSAVAEASYTIKPVDPIEPEKPDTVAKPVFTPNGGEVERGSSVTIHCDTANATIHYTLDGSAPNVQSAVYTAPIVINEAMTLKAMAVRENYVNSPVATAIFTIKSVDPVVPDTVEMPVFTPKGGEVERGATVAITCVTENATIYYTIDGSTPTEQSTRFTTPIVINEAMTLKAMAVRENYVNSEVATATFTIKPIDPVANEAGQTVSLVVYAQDRTICLSEEAGEVSVYTVDGRRVFCGNAVRIPVAAGGIYIVRVAGRSYKLPVR